MTEDPIKYKNSLLGKFHSKQITLDELNKECAYWYLDCFEEISIKAYPTQPNRYRDYVSMDYDEKKEVPRTFWLLNDIKDYLDQKFLIKNENKGKKINDWKKSDLLQLIEIHKSLAKYKTKPKKQKWIEMAKLFTTKN